jgi:flagellar hook-basal body complex protein FliE
MSIAAITGISPSALMPAIQPAGGTATAAGTGDDFGSWLGNALDTVSGAQAKADGLAVQAATGDLTAIHDFTIATSEAQLLTQLTVEVRNRAVEAFNDIMRMQV